MGSPAVGGLIAHLAFWVILLIGILYGELDKRLAALFVVLWAAGYVVIPRLAMGGGYLVTPFVAVLDIALVLLVFKGDIRFF